MNDIPREVKLEQRVTAQQEQILELDAGLNKAMTKLHRIRGFLISCRGAYFEGDGSKETKEFIINGVTDIIEENT